MKRLIPAAFVMSLAVAAPALADPVIVVDHPLFNFGTITEGAKVDHTFTIKNSGDTPLSILHVKPSCGCTAANVSSPTIQPGKTGEVKATFNSTNFSGPMTKTIAVETNDPKKSSFTLTMKGTVTTEIQLNPKQLNFGQVKAGTPATQSIAVENRGSKPLKITGVKSPMPQVVIKNDRQMLKPGETMKIDVTVTTRPEDRILSGYLTIGTDSATKPEIMVPIYGSPTK